MSAPTLMLLHGFMGEPSSWDDVIAALPSARRVIRPALLGHRGGPPADASSSWAAEVSRLAAIVRIEARPESRGVLLIGYSLGARLALAVALSEPACVTRLVLVSGHPGLEHAADRAERCTADDRLARSITADGLTVFVDAWESKPLFGSQRVLAPGARARHRARRLGHEPASLAASLSALSKGRMPWLEPLLAALDVDVTLLVGGRDAAACSSARQMGSLLPRARVLCTPNAGHDLCLERPDAVARAIEGEFVLGEPHDSGLRAIEMNE